MHNKKHHELLNSLFASDQKKFQGRIKPFVFFVTLMAPAVSKRPAGNLNSMKRPAAAPLSVNESVQNLKRGLEDESEECSDEEKKKTTTSMKRPAKASKATEKTEETQEEKQGRDKGKGEKWARMREEGLIPQHILHLYDEGGKGQVYTRDFRTQLINTLFEKNDQGLFAMNASHKMFTEAFKVYQQKFARDESEGLAKSILAGLYFQNNYDTMRPIMMKKTQCWFHHD